MATQTVATGRRFDSPGQVAFLGLWRTYDRLRALEDELFARYCHARQLGHPPHKVPEAIVTHLRTARVPHVALDNPRR